MPRWKLLGSEPALTTPWIVVNKKSYLVEGRSDIQQYYVVERRPFVLAVAVDALGLTMVRQFRQGTDQVYLELPAGYIEDGETAADAALRELREETGVVAARATLVGVLHPLPGYIHSSASVVVCEDLSRQGAGTGAEEIDDVVVVPMPEALQMIVRGEINEMQAVAAILLAKARADLLAPSGAGERARH